MRVVFMGTPQIAVPVLEKLAQTHQVVGVFTRPDAVRGRGKALVPSDVKTAAINLGIPVVEARSLTDEGALEALKAFEPDVACVMAYSALLPPEALNVPAFGCLNVHTSLLPRWRGAAPMERALLEGDECAGVSIMRMEQGLDTGAFCKQVSVDCAGMYLGQLEDVLSQKGSELLVEALSDLEAGTIAWTEQDETKVTYAAKIIKGELDLDPASSVQRAWACVRASSDAHPSHAVLAGKQVTVLQAAPVVHANDREIAGQLEPGEFAFRGKRLFVGFADGMLELQTVKPQGKKSMDARAFCAGIQGIKNAVLKWEKL